MAKHIPNILTLLNMALGLIAILLLMQPEHPHKVSIVVGLVFFGGIIDFLDGFLARKLNTASNLGKQLDSFADIITFGVAPIMLINYISHCQPTILLIASSLVFMLAGAYRLARFNLNDFSKHFVGLPITAAGITLVVFGIAYKLWLINLPIAACIIITNAVIITLSVMMISKRKFRRV